MKTNASKLILFASSALVLLIGFQVAAKKKSAPAVQAAKAVAVLGATDGNMVSGVVTFTKEGDKVKVSAHLQGLMPGKHGFHVHEFGDCSSKDGTAAGGHFNPATVAHGAREASPRHIGDLGNLEADSSGMAHVEFTDSVLKLDGPTSIIGHAVIIHAKVDDYSQPVGNAGSRQACGVIGLAKP